MTARRAVYYAQKLSILDCAGLKRCVRILDPVGGLMNRLRNCKLALILVVVAMHGLVAVRNRVDAAEDRTELLPHWKKGQKLRYEMRKKSQRSQGDKVTLNMAAHTDFEIES